MERQEFLPRALIQLAIDEVSAVLCLDLEATPVDFSCDATGRIYIGSYVGVNIKDHPLRDRDVFQPLLALQGAVGLWLIESLPDKDQDQYFTYENAAGRTNHRWQ